MNSPTTSLRSTPCWDQNILALLHTRQEGHCWWWSRRTTTSTHPCWHGLPTGWYAMRGCEKRMILWRRASRQCIFRGCILVAGRGTRATNPVHFSSVNRRWQVIIRKKTGKSSNPSNSLTQFEQDRRNVSTASPEKIFSKVNGFKCSKFDRFGGDFSTFRGTNKKSPMNHRGDTVWFVGLGRKLKIVGAPSIFFGTIFYTYIGPHVNNFLHSDCCWKIETEWWCAFKCSKVNRLECSRSVLFVDAVFRLNSSLSAAGRDLGLSTNKIKYELMLSIN